MKVSAADVLWPEEGRGGGQIIRVLGVGVNKMFSGVGGGLSEKGLHKPSADFSLKKGEGGGT